MKQEEIIKYERKKVSLILKNNFGYKGILNKVYEDSIDFTDMYDTEMTISIDNIAMISILNESKATQSIKINDVKGKVEAKNIIVKENNAQMPTKAEEKMAKEKATEKQINMLTKRLGYKGDTSKLSKLEARNLIEELLSIQEKEKGEVYY